MNIYKITQNILGWKEDKKQKTALMLAAEVERLLKENEKLERDLFGFIYAG
jgi:hypothetical protein